METSLLRTALQKEAADNIELAEALYGMLRRKAESKFEVIAPAQQEDVLEFWRAVMDMHVIQNRLSQERHRLSVLNSYRYPC